MLPLKEAYKIAIKQRGGKCFGKGAFGTVCSVEEAYNKVAKVPLFLYTHNVVTNTEVVLTYSDMRSFISEYDDELVFKVIEGRNDTETAMLTNIEIENTFQLSNVPNNISHKLSFNDQDHILKYFTLYTKTSTRYPVYTRMNGDLLLLQRLYGNTDIYVSLLQVAKTQTLEFLMALHELGLYHYDIKPENILFKYRNGTFDFAVGDYGLVGSKDDKLRGTYGFIAPSFYESRDEFYEDGVSIFPEATLDTIWAFYKSRNVNSPDFNVAGDMYSYGVTFYLLFRSIYPKMAEFMFRRFVLFRGIPQSSLRNIKHVRAVRVMDAYLQERQRTIDDFIVGDLIDVTKLPNTEMFKPHKPVLSNLSKSAYMEVYRHFAVAKSGGKRSGRKPK